MLFWDGRRYTIILAFINPLLCANNSTYFIFFFSYQSYELRNYHNSNFTKGEAEIREVDSPKIIHLESGRTGI
jgi:hypothetical protein